ncbi:MAG: ABC transporter permease [Acidimicrobiia bacterium]|nr:ABC transporter permease [Acidimicrobiia bacterium]
MTTFLRLTIFGLVAGGSYSVAASGLVLTYTTSGIFNFAHGAIGMLAAFLYWELHVHRGWPTLLALIAVLVFFAPLAGALVERFLVRPLEGASLSTMLVVTVGLLVGCIGLAQTIWPPESRVVEEFFAPHGFRVFDVFVSWHKAMTMLVAVGVALGLRLLLRSTKRGITMRAVVDDRDLSSLSGANPAHTSMLSWAIGASLASLAGILLAPILTLDVVPLTLLVINAYAAAVVGGLQSISLTFGGAMLLGLLQSYASTYLPKVFPGDRLPDWLPGLNDSIPVLLLFVALLALPQARLHGTRVIRAAAERVPPVRQSIAAALALVGCAYVVVGFLSNRDVTRVGEGLAIGLIGLSLVPLTGYAGQVSLCPLAFAGLGAVMMSKFGGGGSWIGLVAAVGVPAAVGALVALPALRLQGLYLALSTLAFAVLMDNMIFPQRRLFWTSSVTVDRPDIPFVSLASDRAWFVVLAGAYGALAVFVLAVRRGSFGRRLLALKDSPVACATLGMSLTRTKLVVFALSAGMAGLGGALYAALRVGVSAKSFTAVGGLGILLIAVIGGIEMASGPLVGGLTLAAMTIVSQEIAALDWLAAIGPAFVAVTLARNREGLAIRLAEIGRGLAGWRPRRSKLETDWLATIDATLPPHVALQPEQVDALEEVFRLEPALCTSEPVR